LTDFSRAQEPHRSRVVPITNDAIQPLASAPPDAMSRPMATCFFGRIANDSYVREFANLLYDLIAKKQMDPTFFSERLRMSGGARVSGRRRRTISILDDQK